MKALRKCTNIFPILICEDIMFKSTNKSILYAKNASLLKIFILFSSFLRNGSFIIKIHSFVWRVETDVTTTQAHTDHVNTRWTFPGKYTTCFLSTSISLSVKIYFIDAGAEVPFSVRQHLSFFPCFYYINKEQVVNSWECSSVMFFPKK